MTPATFRTIREGLGLTTEENPVRTLTITDTIHLRTVTEDKGEAVDAIRAWFPEAPREVVDQLDQLDGILSHGRGWEHLEELESALGIHVEIA